MRGFSYIVVGAGSAGCVVASRLSEDPSVRVLLLEAGGADRHPLMSAPLAFFPLMRDRRLSWPYQTEPEPFAESRVVDLPRGRVLGGSSSINGMMYARGHARDYDEWERLGCKGWSYADVLPYFRRAESSWRGEGAYHGAAGPLTVSASHTPDGVIAPALLETARRLGYPIIDDFHGPDQEGFSFPEFTVHGGRRGSTAARYLRPALGRANLKVATSVLVTRILLEKSRAVGVEYVKDGQTVQAQAEHEVILCGGAYNSPQLLMLSGIGPADELAAVGIKPAHDLPGVGRNLQEHAAAGVTYAARGPFSFESQLRFDRLALSVIRWALTGTGPVSRLPVSVMAFLRTRPEFELPDFQILFSPVGMDAVVWFPGLRKGKGHLLSMAATLLRPESRGWVKLRSADPTDPPRIQLNLFQQEADVSALIRAIRLLREFFAAEPARGLVADEIFPGPQAQDDRALADVIRATGGVAHHPTSTCAMGADDDAVVDPELKVRGVEALRVIDASAAPRIMGGNTNAPAIMIGEKGSDLVLGRSLPRASV